MKHIKKPTYEGMGFTDEERDFLIDGYAVVLYMRTLQRDSKEYLEAHCKLTKIHSDYNHLVDSINDKVKTSIKGDE